MQIQAPNGQGDIWQGLAPSETVESDGTAQQIAYDTDANQNVTDGPYRICVWEGEDTGAQPAWTHYVGETEQV